MTEQTQPDPTGTVISQRDQRRIVAAMMKMPYAASSRVPQPWTAMGETVTAEAVVAFLDGLAEVLTEVSAENDAMHYWLRSLTDAPLLDKAARLAARQIGEPSWPADVWPRDRARWIASLKEANTRPATVAAYAFAEAVYGSHPYGVRTTEESLMRIGVADMQAFHAQHIAACRAKVSIVGAVSRSQAQALVATLLSRLPETSGCAPLPPVGEISALTAPVE